jgi:hypothetical protein
MKYIGGRARIQIPEGSSVTIRTKYGEDTASATDWIVRGRGIEDKEGDETLFIVPDNILRNLENRVI